MSKKKVVIKKTIMMNPDYNDDACTGIVKLGDEYFTVHVMGREGKKPKLHLLDKYNNSVCRIRLDKPEYADEESIRLNDKQIEDLNNYLSSNDNPYFSDSNWTILKSAWNGPIDNKHFDTSIQPDYTLLNKKENK